MSENRPGTEPPRLLDSPQVHPHSEPASPIEVAAAIEPATPIEPVAFKPQRLEAGSGRRVLPTAPQAGILALVLLLALVAFVFFTAVPVEIVVSPEPERLALSGTLPLPSVGGRRLMRTGLQVIEAEKAGYQKLEQSFDVGRGSGQSFRFELEKLGGVLDLELQPADAQVEIDGAAITNLGDIQLTPGEHRIRVSAERYRDFDQSVSIEGLGTTTPLAVTLEPAWASLSFTSTPSSEVLLDGRSLGRTPTTVEILEGTHDVELRASRFRTERRRIEVRAGEDRSLPEVILEPAVARLRVESVPPGATVLIDGEFRGEAPVDVEVAPERVHQVTTSLAGFAPVRREVSVGAGEEHDLRLELSAELGEIRLAVEPADATLWIDGEVYGPAKGTLRLPVVPLAIAVRKDGYETYRTTVIPTPGIEQVLQLSLTSSDELRAAETPPRVESPLGQDLVLIGTGRLTLGASRREPGRRSNETLHTVELTRPFYISVHEVTNEEFREFREEHRSGAAGEVNLEGDNKPVVRVTWEDAIFYCNWLSERDGLPAAYERRDGRWVGASPMTTGYRLPSESEWAWVARYPDAKDALKYPWGAGMPIQPKSGNYADRSTGALVSGSRSDYNDGFPATSPVGKFPPNPLGIYDLGGNVAEWVHDAYFIYPSGAEEVLTDPLGPEGGELHTIRGSSWMHYSVSDLRLAHRDYGRDGRPDLGFRIARYAR